MRRQTRETFYREAQGRPPIQVWGSRGIACAMHPLATQAALDVLQAGGNAIDAAVALGAMIGVTNHDWAGIGGDSAWLVYWAKTGELFHLDGYSACPGRLTSEVLARACGVDRDTHPEAYREEPAGYRDRGVITAMVPGTPAAWSAAWERFGRLRWSSLFEPAIAAAAEGVPVNGYVAKGLRKSYGKIRQCDTTRRIFCRPNGEPLREGETLRQPDLARTYQRLAAEGRDGFYRGETARRIVEYGQAHGGVIELEDLEGYQAAWRAPEHGSYRGLQVVVSGLPTSGIYVLEALNILEGYELESMDYHGLESLHTLIEATKLALADRRRGAGDPDFVGFDVSTVLDKGYAETLRRRIRMGQVLAIAKVASTQSSTTHFVVVDAEGNIVSATQTIGSAFGCGEVVDGTGIVLNDRTWWMALGPSANRVAPGRRANIGHAPTIVLREGRPYLALGSPGGFGIVQFVLQTIVNVVDYGLSIQDAVEAPRYRLEDLAYRVGMETRIGADVRQGLANWGHEVIEYPAWTDLVGGVEAACIDAESGNVLAGYDPRRNSMAGSVR